MVVVVAEHRDDRAVDEAGGVRDDEGLLGLAVRGQVAGEEHEVDVVEARERALDALRAPLPTRARRPRRRSGSVPLTDSVPYQGLRPSTPRVTGAACPAPTRWRALS